ncbi:MAG: O-antigen ligase family protein [Planctomycetota bacterium]|nr:O-antigen ligase family protein [Planctomycetota bacterium]MDA1177236.1 O-antigen ligase family protein [Planctomycetota bacterium]
MSAFSTGYSISPTYGHEATQLVGPHDQVRKGIWPVSNSIWFSCFYIAAFIIRPWEKLFPWLEAVRFERSFVILLFLVVLTDRGFRIVFDKQTLAFLGLIMALVICTVTATDPGEAWGGNRGLYTYLTTAFGFFLFLSVIRTKYELTFLVTCQLVATGLYLGKSLWEFHLHGAGSTSMGVHRLSGIDIMHSHPNSVAAMTVLSLPIWSFVWNARETFASTWPPFWQTWFTRSLKFYLVIVVLTLMGANSRTSYVTATLFGVLFIRRHNSFNQQIKYLIGFVAVAVMVWVSLPQASRDRIESIWNEKASNESAKESADGRILGFKAGMEMFRRSPIVGIGVNNFMPYRDQRIDGVKLVAHNAAGEILGQTGLVGATAFVVFVVVMIGNAYQLLRTHPDRAMTSSDFNTNFGLMGRDTVILLLIHGLTMDTLFHYSWVWMSAFLAIAVQQSRDEMPH